jgi:hypothetical protein
MWSNETKINCLGSYDRTYVYKNEGKGLSDSDVEVTVSLKTEIR